MNSFFVVTILPSLHREGASDCVIVMTVYRLRYPRDVNLYTNITEARLERTGTTNRFWLGEAGCSDSICFFFGRGTRHTRLLTISGVFGASCASSRNYGSGSGSGSGSSQRSYLASRQPKPTLDACIYSGLSRRCLSETMRVPCIFPSIGISKLEAHTSMATAVAAFASSPRSSL